MDKKMLKRIYQTVSAYYVINKDVLSDKELKNLTEQKAALKKALSKL